MANPRYTREFRHSPFMSAVLAPLPTTEEQVASRRFLLDLRADMKRAWMEEPGLNAVDRARCAYGALELDDPRRHDLWQRFVDLVDRQMRLPADGRQALTWKNRYRKLNGGRPEWNDAIARDEEWIARLHAAGIFNRKAALLDRASVGRAGETA